MTNTIPFGNWGIEWDKIKNKFEILELNKINILFKLIHKFVKNPSQDIYIIKDSDRWPIIKTKLYNATRVIKDTLPNSWLFCPKSKYIIEINFDKIRIGFID